MVLGSAPLVADLAGCCWLMELSYARTLRTREFRAQLAPIVLNQPSRPAVRVLTLFGVF